MTYTWDQQKRRYVRDDGTVVPEQQIKTWLDDLLAAIVLLFLSRADSYYKGDLAFNSFYQQIETDISSLHYSAGALAMGGFDQLSQEDTNRIETAILAQGAWYRALMISIYYQLVSEAAAKARLAMYALAGYATYENSRVEREKKAMMLIYRRRLSRGADSCEDCISYAFRGWSRLGTLPGIASDCACKSHCRCYFEFSTDLSLLGKP